ncbi:phage major capsid protein [Jatrophihabitans sp. DSM 45814]
MSKSTLPIHPRTGLEAIGVTRRGPVWPALGGEAGVLEATRERRDALSRQIDEALAAPIPEDRTEARAANDAVQTLIEERTQLDERLRVIQEQEARRAADADVQRRLSGGVDALGQPRAVITREPRTYDSYQRSSYFLDLARVQLQRGDGDGGVDAARDRLARHAKELSIELPAREARRDEAAREGTDHELRRSGYNRRARENAFEKRVNPNRTDGQGGNFVPPLWLIDEYIDLPRFGRTTANLCNTMALPSGTDSINLPKVASGTTAAIQAADAAGVSSTDLTDTSVSAPVRTIAGQQDIAIQLLDQSPISFDEVVMADLLADYNMKLDLQVINGSGTSGQVTGILNVSGINAVTYTDATPTLPELWVPLLQAASKVANLRKMPATGTVMTPSLWYWALSQLDSTNRPLLVPNTNAMNSMGDNGLLEADGPAGMFTYGLPAFLDGNIPSNLGAGTNETRSITARWQDLFLWEGSMRTRVLSEVLSNTLQVRIQVYNYVAFMGNRRPEAISVIAGTGLISPAGF